jgi:hypothetical protein
MGNEYYWGSQVPDPNDEWVGRLVKNSFGIDETVMLMARDWKHFDWLEDQGLDMVQWTMNADIDRHRPEYQMDLAGELQVSLRQDEKRRYLAGLECPMFIEPEGYSGAIISEEIPERMLNDNEWFEREVPNLELQQISIMMQGKHWRYFDWLDERQGNMHKLVSEAEKQSAEADYLNGNQIWEFKVPLFISPNGYMNADLRIDGKRGVERQLENAQGQIETIPLPRAYWQYFDWLAKQGIDMAALVKKADRTRYKSDGKVYTLRSEIIMLLREDEKRRFMSDEPSPLFITPEGYDL